MQDGDEIATYVGGGGVLAAAVALGLRWVWRVFSQEGTTIAAAKGESTIIDRLREEVDRLATVNANLSRIIGELQTEIVGLRQENGDLREEIAGLARQVRRLQDGAR